MLSINTNLSSLIAQQSLSSSTTKLNQAIERMSTGFKINHAKDNAANYSISTNLTTKIGAYLVAEDNVSMGLDMLTTAEESLGQINDKLTRLRDLATQAGNGTYGASSLNAINSEVNALVDEINRLYNTAEYNGRKIFFQDSDATSAVAAYGVRAMSIGVTPAVAAYSAQEMSTDTTPAVAAYSARAMSTDATPAVAAYGAQETSTNTTYTDEEVAAMIELTNDVISFTEGGKYAIYDADQLVHLAELVNSGALTNINVVTFVLANDIDMEGVEWTPIGNISNKFYGTFDGNGHVISKLKIDSTSDYQGLFGYVYARGYGDAIIQNVGLEEVSVKGNNYVGGLVGSATASGSNVILNNNYVTGDVSGTGNYVGGLVGELYADYGTLTFNNNYATCDVSGQNFVGGLVGAAIADYGGTLSLNNNYTMDVVGGGTYVGGLVGYTTANFTSQALNNNYTTSEVTGSANVGGFVGNNSGATFTNNASSQSDRYVTQMTAEEILDSANLEAMGFTEASGWTIVDGQPTKAWSLLANPREVKNPTPPSSQLSNSNITILQVGINSSEHSQIELEFGFSLEGLDDLRMIGLDTTTDFLSKIDTMIATVNAKQTEYGAVENRLTSALDEISTQYENLVSTRSTIRDVDVANESSTYIRQQILQQASATLLATANQSPSIALQLI